MDEKILGIYLGTSNSAACVFIDNKATMIPPHLNVVYNKWEVVCDLPFI